MPIKRIWAVTEYQGLAHQLLHSFKFERAIAAAPIIAAAISDSIPFLPKDTIIVSVPTATSRIRQRGYDHADLIANHFANLRGLSKINAACRLTQSRQVGANRHQRKTQLIGAFTIIRPDAIKGANILIIDDVATTGATLEALAGSLKSAGAKTICAAVFAQKH
jgi:ComF family protein